MNSSIVKHRGMQGFIQVLLSNGVLILMGVISSFIVPGNITPMEFGYWQTYLLYDTYVGLVLFGYCDGIYLRYGGQNYDNLPSELFSSLFAVMFLYLVGTAALLIFIISNGDTSAKDCYIFYAVVVSMVLRCTISFFVLINQATARFKVYSIGNTVEKIFFVCAVIVIVCFSKLSMYTLIIASISGQLLALFYNLITSRRLLTVHIHLNREVWKDAGANIVAGFPLTMSGISSMLMSGIGKFSVEHYLGKEQFGYYSFAFPMMAVVSQVIAAASLVLFPILKQTDARNIDKLLVLADKWSIPAFFAVMFVYIPASIVVKALLPSYKPTLPCLLILLPTLFFQAKITMVYNTILKIQRRERTIMFNGFIATLCCCVITLLSIHASSSLIAIAASTTCSYLIWSILSKKALLDKNITNRGHNI